MLKGAKNLDKCPLEPFIPIWNVVNGSVSILLVLISSITAVVTLW